MNCARTFIAVDSQDIKRACRDPHGNWLVEVVLAGQNACCLAADPRNKEVVYAGLTYGDVWHSADYGDSWRKLPFNLGRIWRSMILVNDGTLAS